MTILVDTRVLARLCNSADESHALAMQAVVNLHAAGKDLRLTPQILMEFRCVATRPTGANGLGLGSADADARAAAFEELLPLRPDVEEVFPAWKEIVCSLGIIGKQVHDARLAACRRAHRVSQFLTFNSAHFSRLAAAVPGLIVVSPVEISAHLNQ